MAEKQSDISWGKRWGTYVSYSPGQEPSIWSGEYLDYELEPSSSEEEDGKEGGKEKTENEACLTFGDPQLVTPAVAYFYPFPVLDFRI